MDMQKKRIWEIDDMFYCPITGVCLTIPEQKQFLKRCGAKVKDVSTYALHTMLIQEARTETKTAKRLEKTLNRKYRKEIAAWETMPDEEWLSFFVQNLNISTVGALLWFSVIYLELSQEQQVDIYSSIHMLLHEQFLQQSVLLKKLERVEKMHKILQEKYQTLRIQLRHEHKSHHNCERQYALRQQELNTLRAENLKLKQGKQIAEGQADCDILRQKLYRTEKKLHTRTVAVEKLKAERNQLQQDLEARRLFIEEIQDEFTKILEQFKQTASQAEHCPNVALCNRRILIVGGMTKLRSFYEQLVTKMGGQFEYHDGYKYNGNGNLSHLVDRSDVVICPVDVNSHSACLHVKKCCKELNKPYYMLRNSSISTIHQTLTQVAAMSN
jgi:hypothetical protein